jgi:hypothetical protein
MKAGIENLPPAAEPEKALWKECARKYTKKSEVEHRENTR